MLMLFVFLYIVWSCLSFFVLIGVLCFYLPCDDFSKKNTLSLWDMLWLSLFILLSLLLALIYYYYFLDNAYPYDSIETQIRGSNLLKKINDYEKRIKDFIKFNGFFTLYFCFIFVYILIFYSEGISFYNDILLSILPYVLAAFTCIVILSFVIYLQFFSSITADKVDADIKIKRNNRDGLVDSWFIPWVILVVVTALCLFLFASNS